MYLINYFIESPALVCQNDPKFVRVLKDILVTPVSPELIPPIKGEISQKTESILGEYLLHDFFLYYYVRCAFAPAKILRLALSAFAAKYSPDYIENTLNTFMSRFPRAQFKRNAMPDGVKIGSVSLSPRGDWRMPSDL